MSDSDDDCLARTMTSERSDACGDEYNECFGDSLRKGLRMPQDPFAPSNDDDYFFENHNVVDGLYVSSLVAPPPDEFPLGSKVYIVADLKELKRTMGPYYFEEKMFRLMGGARRITGRVMRHHGDYTVVEFLLPLEDMFSGTHVRKLGGGGFRRASLQHRKSISLAPDGQTLFPNVSSYNYPNNHHNNTINGGAAPPDMLDGTCAPSFGAFDSTQRPMNTTVNAENAPHHPPPEVKRLSLGGIGGGGNSTINGGGGMLSNRPMNSSRPPLGSARRSTLASPRTTTTPRGGAALLTPRSAAAQAEKIAVSYTFHRSVIEVEEC